MILDSVGINAEKALLFTATATTIMFAVVLL
jgi:hypothetical protein